MLRVAVIAIALCGCGDKHDSQVKAVRDEVCACRDVPCAEEAIKKVPASTSTPSHRARALASEMMLCLSKLYLKPEDKDEKADEQPAEPLTVPDLLPSNDKIQINPNGKRPAPRNPNVP